MSDQIQDAEVVQETPAATQPVEKTEQIDIDGATAFHLKLQEFDKKISEAELAVAELKKQKATFIYDNNVQQIVLAHKEKVIKAQIEKEAKEKMAQAQ